MKSEHWTECLCVVLENSDIEEGRVHFFGSSLPLNDRANVGDVIRIPIKPDRYFISKEPAVILDKKAQEEKANERK